jgi:hypothetical protein
MPPSPAAVVGGIALLALLALLATDGRRREGLENQQCLRLDCIRTFVAWLTTAQVPAAPGSFVMHHPTTECNDCNAFSRFVGGKTYNTDGYIERQRDGGLLLKGRFGPRGAFAPLACRDPKDCARQVMVKLGNPAYAQAKARFNDDTPPNVVGRHGSEVVAEVEAYYRKIIAADKTLALDPARVAVYTKCVAPRTPEEVHILAFYQREIARLMQELRTNHAADERTKVLFAVYKGKVGVDVSGNQGVMHSRGYWTTTPDFVMAINVAQPVAKCLSVIAHEMAHAMMGGMPPDWDKKLLDYKKYPGGHGPEHTAAWAWLAGIGIKKLGWKYLEVAYPSICKNYNLCKPRMDFAEGRDNIVFSNSLALPGYSSS